MDKSLNDITGKVIAAAIEVHRELGPGLLESVYHSCLVRELSYAGLSCDSELTVPVMYKGHVIQQDGMRIDILVEDSVVIELKSVETVLPVHKKQLLTYLRLTNKRFGLLINFNECLLKDGITRIAN